MNNRRNYYRILNVQPDAPGEIILASYRTLMQVLKQHPDLGGDHWNAALINEAFTTLSDQAQRDEYDQQLKSQGRDARPDAAAHSNSKQPRDGQRPGDVRQATPDDVCPFCKSPHGHGSRIDADTLCLDCGSPLRAAPSLNTARSLRPDESDRRAIQRFTQQHAISFCSKWPQPEGHTGQTLDISYNGMQFVSQQPVVKGQFLKIDCDLCSAVAEVTRCVQQRSGPGVSWIVGVVFITQRFEPSPSTFVSTIA